MSSSNPKRKQWGAVLWLLVILVVPCCLCSGSAWLIAGRPWAYLVLAAFFAFCLIGAVSGALTWLVVRRRNAKNR